MTVHHVNPDSTILLQLAGQWERIVLAIIHKHYKHTGVTITFKDLLALAADIEAGNAVLLTHGHFDSIEFKLVTAERARELAAYDAKQRGRA